MRFLGTLNGYNFVSGLKPLNNGKERKMTKQGTKNLKTISKVLTKANKSAQIAQFVNISDKWVDEITKNKNFVEEINLSWAINHGKNTNSRYIVSFRKLHTIKNGITPVLINKDEPTTLYGEYELVDLYGWNKETNKATVLYKMATQIFTESYNLIEFGEEALGYEVGRDKLGYYIIRNTRDFTGRNFVTYFLPADCII